MAEFRMPSLGADMEAGTLVEWLVKPGDWVKRGDIVAVVETQKGAIEIKIFETGQIEQILVDLGDTVPVGVRLARIRTGIETQAEIPSAAPPSVEPIASPAIEGALPSGPTLAPSVHRQPPPVGRVPGVAARVPGVAARVRMSPAARRFAETRSVDLSGISGTGPAGAIIRADVERHLGAPKGAPERKRAVGLDLDGMRAAIAAAMARSKREIPHYYLEHQIDVTACEQWLIQTNASRPPESRLLMGVLALKAVALAARRFPAFNGFYRDEHYQPAAAVHVGVAIAIRGGGLAAPALHDADRIPLDDLMTRMRDGDRPRGVWEKRNIAKEVPVWRSDLCIQCGQCSFVCPHSVIRAKYYGESLLEGAPQTFKSVPVNARGYPDVRFSLQFYVEDCTGCGLCVESCPARSSLDPGIKAINLEPREPLVKTERANIAFFERLPINDRARVDFANVRGVQFLEPLFEFPGACAGCGETPYLKLLSQLFGDRMMVANATGCSSIYGANLPVTPWSKNQEGRGPAWSNSLFEDGAEFGLGFRLTADKHRDLATAYP